MDSRLYPVIQQLCPQCEVDLHNIEHWLKSKFIPKGGVLFHEGDVCTFVGITMQGCMRTFFLNDGKELTLFFHPESEPFGDYESFRRCSPAHFSCQAIEDSEVLIVTEQVIQAVERLTNGEKFIRLLVENLTFQLRDRLLSLYRDSSEERYLAFLQHQSELLPRIPQHYIASYLGIAPESLSLLKRRVHQRQLS